MSTQRDRSTSVLQDKQSIDAIIAVSRLSRQINASLNLQETLDAIVKICAEFVGCSLSEIDLWDEEHQLLILQAICSSPERAYPIENHNHPMRSSIVSPRKGIHGLGGTP